MDGTQPGEEAGPDEQSARSEPEGKDYPEDSRGETSMSSGNGSSAKAVGSVLGILALVAGVFAMVEPMTQRIDHLERELLEFRHSTDRIHDRLDETLQREMRVLDDVTATRITELESNLRRSIERIEGWQNRHDDNYPPAWLVDQVNRLNNAVFVCKDGVECDPKDEK